MRFLLVALLLFSGACEFQGEAWLQESRTLSDGTVIYRLELPHYAAAGNLLWTGQTYCPKSAIVLSPSVRSGDRVLVSGPGCHSMIAEFGK